MCMCVYVCVCVCESVCMCVYVCVCVCVFLFLVDVSTVSLQKSIMQTPCDSCKQSDRPLTSAAKQGHTDC